jgi:hypothetical protein
MNSQNKPQSPYAYTTYHTEEDQHNGGESQFRRVYDIPEGTRNVYVAFTPGKFTSGGTANEARLQSFRFSINNEDVLGREVPMYSPLYYELINQVHVNKGVRLKSLDSKTFAPLSSVGRGNSNGTELQVLSCPVPISNQVQKLGLELNTGAVGGLPATHVLYFERLKAM